MMHFQNGGNWYEEPMAFHVDPKQDIENTLVYYQVQDLEGLSDRQIAIVEMKMRWGWTRIGDFDG